MAEKIGVLVGMEQPFPAALIERINKTPGVHAELAKIDATPERFASQYRVLVDRISHEVPFYRFHLKAASLAGTYVINDPFWFTADDKFFGFSLAAKIGVPVPRTVLLPQKQYMERIDPARSLRNLVYPLDWEGIARYVGFPAILKPADGGGWRNVTRVNDLGELIRDYDASGQLCMTLQQFIDFDDYVRCLCIGKEEIRPIRYDPKRRCYLPDQGWLPKKLEEQIVEGARALNRALGYDMNSVEFAIKDGVPYAIDFTNPAPDMDRNAILPHNFEWCVEKMAALCIALARSGKPQDGSYAFQRHLARQEAAGKAPQAISGLPWAKAGQG